ncbi:hypothetical protein [Parasphingorhabdus sp.]|uniref:hypothetical protein n=1 Tax=Parasphingorhabdus sp. TaxID=2709688 RepID=UPI00300163B2
MPDLYASINSACLASRLSPFLPIEGQVRDFFLNLVKIVKFISKRTPDINRVAPDRAVS